MQHAPTIVKIKLRVTFWDLSELDPSGPILVDWRP